MEKRELNLWDLPGYSACAHDEPPQRVTGTAERPVQWSMSRTMLRFTIRDLLWLTLLASVVVAWWLDHRTLLKRLGDKEKMARAACIW
jgi:hypothetical protein